MGVYPDTFKVRRMLDDDSDIDKDKGPQIYYVREFTEIIAELAWKYGLDENETGNTPPPSRKKNSH